MFPINKMLSYWVYNRLKKVNAEPERFKSVQFYHSEAVVLGHVFFHKFPETF